MPFFSEFMQLTSVVSILQSFYVLLNLFIHFVALFLYEFYLSQAYTLVSISKQCSMQWFANIDLILYKIKR